MRHSHKLEGLADKNSPRRSRKLLVKRYEKYKEGVYEMNENLYIRASDIYKSTDCSNLDDPFILPHYRCVLRFC